MTSKGSYLDYLLVGSDRNFEIVVVIDKAALQLLGFVV
jgi:hypothetical protein